MNSQRKSFNSIQKSLNAVCKSVGSVMKAEEGDTRMIFGKPATYTSGEWKTDTDGNGTPDTKVKPLPKEGLEDEMSDEGDDEFADINYPDESELDEEESETPPEMADSMRQFLIDNDRIEEDDELDNIDIESIFDTEVENGDASYDDLDKYMKNEDFVPKSCDKPKVVKSINNSYRTVQKALAGTYDNMMKTGATTTDEEHSHAYKLDVDGTGSTTAMIGSHGIPHTHSIKEYAISIINGHSHEVI